MKSLGAQIIYHWYKFWLFMAFYSAALLSSDGTLAWSLSSTLISPSNICAIPWFHMIKTYICFFILIQAFQYHIFFWHPTPYLKRNKCSVVLTYHLLTVHISSVSQKVKPIVESKSNRFYHFFLPLHLASFLLCLICYIQKSTSYRRFLATP